MIHDGKSTMQHFSDEYIKDSSKENYDRLVAVTAIELVEEAREMARRCAAVGHSQALDDDDNLSLKFIEEVMEELAGNINISLFPAGLELARPPYLDEGQAFALCDALHWLIFFYSPSALAESAEAELTESQAVIVGYLPLARKFFREDVLVAARSNFEL